MEDINQGRERCRKWSSKGMERKETTRSEEESSRLSGQEWSRQACEAEANQSWTRAQFLWECALVETVKDSDTKAKAYGTGLVILSHIHDLMKEHFGFQARTTLDRFFSKEAYTPVGNWKKLQECQETHTLSTVSKSGILMRIWLALIVGLGLFLISYPFSKFTKGIVLGAGVVLVFALAILIGKLTNFFGGLIALFVGTYLADTLSQSMCKWLHLESDLVGLLYILRIIGGVMGIILLCWAVAGIRDNRKNVQRIANALNAAASLKQLAEECHEAAETICAPLIREEIPEIAAMRAKMIYQKADQWAFQRVKGSAEESWGDALEMQTELLAMCDYYADMLEMTKK